MLGTQRESEASILWRNYTAGAFHKNRFLEARAIPVMTAKVFFRRLLAALGATLCLLGLFNWLINPVWLFSSPAIEGINYFKTASYLEAFITKPHAVSRLNPSGIILGTSRAATSLNTDHPGWRDYSAYNFALPGTTAFIQWRNFQHASAQGNLRFALVSLDFLMFNSCRDLRTKPHFRTYVERLEGGDTINWRFPQRGFTDYIAGLTSLDMLQLSWAAIRSQERFAAGNPAMHLRADGFRQNYVKQGKRQKLLFRQIEKQYMGAGWFPPPLNCFRLSLNGDKRQLRHLSDLLRQAYAQRTSTILYFSPFHARLATAMYAVGLWPQWEQLKREVLQINLDLAAAGGYEPYPLWDFSGYNSVNTEPVPAPADSRTRMKYFFDSTHATPLTGKFVQDKVFALPSPGEQAPEDFGVRLSAGNIEQLLLADRVSRDSWIAQNPEDVAEIRAL
jgi:hypothetical protein